MAQLKYSITFDLGAKLDVTAMVNKQVFPLLNQAVKALAQQTAANWQEAVYGAKLWSGEKDAYAQSIRWEMTGDFSAVVLTDYKHAEAIETGRPARDLKKMLDTSQKVRRTESGKRFLVIPFRHNTPGNGALAKPMPTSVHALAKNMEGSSIAGHHLRDVGEVMRLSPKSGMSKSANQSPFLTNTKTKAAAQTAGRSYAWGGRISAAIMKQAGLDPKEHKNMLGMIRFQHAKLPGAKRSSQYMTFRIMVEGSSGWIVPAQPGQFLAKKVVEEMRPKAQQAFAEAIKQTLSKK